jgi:hypothetical protein
MTEKPPCCLNCQQTEIKVKKKFDLFFESIIIRIHWRGGRVAEGAPLLREYLVYSRIEGSNPSLSAITFKACEVMKSKEIYISLD